MDNSSKLKATIRAKSARRKPKSKESSSETSIPQDMDLMSMLENVNKMLKTNPQMLQQINKCVSTVMENKDLMESIKSQVQTNDINSVAESLDALSNESKQ